MMLMSEISALPSDASAAATPGSNPGAVAGSGLMRLRAEFGQEEASHGTARFPVGNDGLIEVPMEAVGPLITVGGFVLVESGGKPASFGVLRLHHGDAAACSYGGVGYLGGVNGDVFVPASAAAELSSHGFVAVLHDVTAPLAQAKASLRSRSQKG